MEKDLIDLVALNEEAGRFAASLIPGTRATLVTLSGELGAGKTAFTQAVARSFGVEESVTSPSFVLEKSYQLPAGAAFSRLVHIDAYRLSSKEDLPALDLDTIMQDTGTLILLEWPERLDGALPEAAARLTFTVTKDNARHLTYA